MFPWQINIDNIKNDLVSNRYHVVNAKFSMMRQIISLTLLTFDTLPMLAYDRHGRYYSVNGGGGSSTMFLIIGVIILFLFIWFNSGKNDKK